MKHTTSLLLIFLSIGTLVGQNSLKIVPPYANPYKNAWPLFEERIPAIIQNTDAISDIPLGTTHLDAVSTIKIGESSNLLSTLLIEANQLSVKHGIGQNGGSIGFIYRQNSGPCGGTAQDNRHYRYSISTDGGLSWDVGSGTNTGGTPPLNGCYGIGPLNYNFLVNGSALYPNVHLFLPPDSAASLDNLGLVYAGMMYPGNDDQEGVMVGYADSIVFNPPAVRQGIYFGSTSGVFSAFSLVERVPGEFFFLTHYSIGLTSLTGDIQVFRGILDPIDQHLVWEVQEIIQPDYFLGYDGNPKFKNASIAFSPDGSVGYIAGIGDLMGDVDTALTVWLSKSTDGGESWSAPFAYDLQAIGDFADSMHIWQEVYPILDSLSGDTLSLDTVFVGGNYPTIVGGIDLVVDQNNIPHAIATVGHGSVHNGDGTYSDPNYQIWSGPFLESYVLDFTIDSFGDPNILYLDRQDWLVGTAGDDSVSHLGGFSILPFTQASRSSDGELLFFSWTDSDASADTAHDHPNLYTRGYDVQNGMMTPVRDHTSDDSVWSGKVFTPHAAPECLFDGADTYTMPIVAMSLDGTDASQPVSHWYFSDIHFDRSNDFSEVPMYFYNCKENPFSNSTQIQLPDCGTNNGEVVLLPGGGIGPYTFQWNNSAGNSTNDTLFTVAAGIYSVVITDSKLCKDTMVVVVDNLGAPQGIVDSVQNVSCAGVSDGQASVVLTASSGGETYLWSNGETSPTAMNLPAGTSICVVQDGNVCFSHFLVDITEPPALVVSVSGTDVLCHDEASGQLLALASGGTGQLHYQWNVGGGTDSLLNGVPAGTYIVWVTDENGCTTTITSSIGEPQPLISHTSTFPNTTSTPPYTGIILTSTSGGIGPYSIQYTSLSGLDTSGLNLSFLNELCADTYTLEITDQNGCMETQIVEVETSGNGVLCEIISTSLEEVDGWRLFDIFPNPSTENSLIRIELDRVETISLEILDMQGRIIHQETQHQVKKWEKEISTRTMVAGVYFVSVITSQTKLTKKWIIL